MPYIKPDTLLTLEAYQKARPHLRTKVLAHKKQRTVHLGHHVTFIFEDEFLMRYQVQEMLRIEKIFDEEGIQHELSAYNPLIPDGSNFKATVMIEYPNESERRIALSQLVKIEHHFFIETEAHNLVYGIADEDLPRSTEQKTSAVHFLRFEFNAIIKQALKNGTSIKLGCDHPDYSIQTDWLSKETMNTLLQDLH
jgi:hypothetical protein